MAGTGVMGTGRREARVWVGEFVVGDEELDWDGAKRWSSWGIDGGDFG